MVPGHNGVLGHLAQLLVEGRFSCHIERVMNRCLSTEATHASAQVREPSFAPKLRAAVSKVSLATISYDLSFDTNT